MLKLWTFVMFGLKWYILYFWVDKWIVTLAYYTKIAFCSVPYYLLKFASPPFLITQLFTSLENTNISAIITKFDTYLITLYCYLMKHTRSRSPRNWKLAVIARSLFYLCVDYTWYWSHMTDEEVLKIILQTSCFPQKNIWLLIRHFLNSFKIFKGALNFNCSK